MDNLANTAESTLAYLDSSPSAYQVQLAYLAAARDEAARNGETS